MKKQFFFYSLLFVFCFANAQNKYDYYWEFSPHVAFNFNQLPSSILDTSDMQGIGSAGALVSMSDKKGRFIFSFDGSIIANKNIQLMLNSNNINHGVYSDLFINSGGGQPYPQQCLGLPFPGDTNRYWVFYENLEYFMNGAEIPNKFQMLEIDTRLDGGLGAVTFKDSVLLNDTLEPGRILAIQHANGRDWWILVRKFLNNKFYKFLLNPTGIHLVGTQNIGTPYVAPSIFYYQGVATQQGDKVLYSEINGNNLGQVDIFDFDRCNGMLSNSKIISLNAITDSVYVTGMSVSPNGKYLYLSGNVYLHQLDLQATNILQSAVLIDWWGGVTTPVTSYFCWHQIGPDGKIYIGLPPAGSSRMKCITNPDMQGVGCGLVHNYIDVTPRYPYMAFHGGMPNNPNYRLGAMVGSGCDTLGIGVEESPTKNVNLNVYPNPARNEIIITDEQGIIKSIQIYDVLGRSLSLTLSKGEGIATLDVSPLTPGIYFLKVANQTGVAKSVKFVKE